jgi:hypothetical protein
MRSPSISPRWVLASPCENREEGRKEGFLARIAIFSFLFVYCGCFFYFFGCQFQNLCVVFFFAVADCEGFWSEGCGTSWFCLLRDRDRTGEATLSTPSFRSYGYGCVEEPWV